MTQNLDVSYLLPRYHGQRVTMDVARQNDPVVQANLPRLLRLHPNGIAPYMVGIPLIS